MTFQERRQKAMQAINTYWTIQSNINNMNFLMMYYKLKSAPVKDCGKKCFDLGGAFYALTSIQKSHGVNRKEKRYYYCWKCKGYHLTSKENLKIK